MQKYRSEKEQSIRRQFLNPATSPPVKLCNAACFMKTVTYFPAVSGWGGEWRTLHAAESTMRKLFFFFFHTLWNARCALVIVIWLPQFPTSNALHIFSEIRTPGRAINKTLLSDCVPCVFATCFLSVCDTNHWARKILLLTVIESKTVLAKSGLNCQKLACGLNKKCVWAVKSPLKSNPWSHPRLTQLYLHHHQQTWNRY